MLISISDLTSTSWHHYKTNFKNLIPYMILFFVPSLIPIFGGVGLQYLSTISSITNETAALISIVLTVFESLLVLWIAIALMLCLGSLVRSAKIVRWQKALRSAIFLLFPLCVNLIITFFITTGPTLLLFLIALFFGKLTLLSFILFFIGASLTTIYAITTAVWFIFSRGELLFNKQTTGMLDVGALSRSKQLVKGRWFTIVFAYFVPNFIFGLIFFAFLFLIAIILSLATFFLSPELQTLIGEIVGALFTAAAVPLPLFVLVNLYFSAKDNPVSKSVS